ncbi:MAG: HD domain-containing protein [Dehalococcoidia bacterium]|nr:HD domain-containing protein [Dehalococcoidia bacterium]
MRRALPNVLPWLVLVGASTAAFFVLRTREGAGEGWSWNSPAGHFWIVSAAALMCAFLAIASGIAASRAANWRVTMIALAFIAMAGIFAVHGLTTPGFIVTGPTRAPAVATVEGYDLAAYEGYGAAAPVEAAAAPGEPTSRFYNVTGLSSRLAILTSVSLLAVAAMRWPASVEAWLTRRRRALLAAGIVTVVTYATLGFLAPWFVPTALVESDAAAIGVTAVVVVLGLLTAARFAHSYRLSAIQLHGATAVGALLLVEAKLSLELGGIWSGTFWLYHVQLLAGFAAIFWGIVIEYSRGQTVRALEALTVSDVMEQLRSGFTEPVVALSSALEARDGYTLGHGERVAALSVLIGQEMRLNPRRLRAIAAGSLLHDVGKIGVPDAVLHKRGSLTSHEYDVIKEHPSRGADMLRNHFDQQTEANVIRYHHERWDGLGYPEGLHGIDIPLEARIAAVADVYDALRSNRAYRPAFIRDDAVPIILDGAGSHFDPDCVDAFLKVVEQWETRYAEDTTEYAERRAA